jgi:hypothetical protein
MMRLVTLVALAAGLIGFYQFARTGHALNAAHVIELKCAGGIRSSKECDEIVQTGADLEILVNDSVNAVNVRVVKDETLNSFEGDYFLKNCTVANRNNWKCTTGTANVYIETGMTGGTYYRFSQPRLIEDYSSINGLYYYLYQAGIYSPTLKSK